MKLISNVIAVAVLMLSSVIVCANTLIPDGLTDDELKIIWLTGYSNPKLERWNEAKLFEIIKENFRRAAVLSRCQYIRKLEPDEYYYDPKIRFDLYMVAKNRMQGKAWPKITPEYMRYKFRNLFWALGKTSEEQRLQLFKAIDDSSELVLNRYYFVRALQEYATLNVDVSTGSSISYPIIELYKLLKSIEQDKVFLKTLKNNDIEMHDLFLKIENQISSEIYDKKYFEELALVFNQKIFNVVDWYLKEMAPEDSVEFSKFVNNEFFKHATVAEATNMEVLITMGKPDLAYSSSLQEINKKFPLPENYLSDALNLSPSLLSGNVHEKYCGKN